MKLLLIPDKFKGSLTNQEVANAIEEGVKSVIPDASTHFFKASDGGDGFLDAVSSYKNVIPMELKTQNPLGRFLNSYYLFDRNAQTAYIELANASGMELLKAEERNPLFTSTYGTGLQIKDAIENGAKHIYIGLGGSATNDAGIGIASALGYSFLDLEGHVLKPIGQNLSKIQKIDSTQVPSAIKGVSFYAVNDVTNPLFGKHGAAYVYARQKGADDEAIVLLDNGLQHLNKVVTHKYGEHYSDVPGSGAAGGTAFGLISFFDAEFVNGIDFVLQLSGVVKLLENEKFDFLVTGEGQIDAQTLHGKLMTGVLKLGKKYDTPVLGICGQLSIDRTELNKIGIYDIIEIRDTKKPRSYNMKYAAKLVQKKVQDYFRSLPMQ